MYASDLYMIGENELIFSGMEEGKSLSDIYLYDFERMKLDLIIKEGTAPTGPMGSNSSDFHAR
jgi:hypothetical protein